MSRAMVRGSAVALVLMVGVAGWQVAAQSPAPPSRAEGGDAAVTALVSEVRALRADLAAAARSQLRAQVLLGRVQMQEQRLAYLDKQRVEAASAAAAQAQMMSMMRFGMPGPDENACRNMPSPDERRGCEQQFAQRQRQLAEQETRIQQLRTQESDLVNALEVEQARWSQFNAQLDELERTLR